LLKVAALVAFLGAAFYVVGYTELGNSLRVRAESISAAIDEFDTVQARLLYVLVYVVGALLLVPGVLLSFIGALLFGVWEGTLYTWIGATIGATLAFWLAKALGRDFVAQRLGGKLQVLDQRVRDRGFVGLLLIRLVPLFPFNVVNFGCGLTGLRTRTYVAATAVGIVPGTFVYQYFFAKLGRRVLEQGITWSDLADVNVLLPIGVFATFLLLTGWLARQFRGPTN